jgi:adenine-specific DNA-methyltransferase
MAAIEDLIKQVADPGLREQLAAEVARLKSTKKFGLVFEEHLPEFVRLPGLTPRAGARVLKKDDPRGLPYRVISLANGQKMRIAPEGGGPEETVARDSVVVAKAFGEAMYRDLRCHCWRARQRSMHSAEVVMALYRVITKRKPREPFQETPDD